MTDRPPPPNPKKRKAKAKAKKKVQEPTADEVQAEVVTAEEVIDEATTLHHDRKAKVYTNRVFSCLWQGEGLPRFSNDVYGLKYVDHLYRGVKRHVPHGSLTMVCDDYYYDKLKENDRFSAVRLERMDGHGIGGWSNMFEIVRENLRPKMGRRHVWVGLDTVFVGNCQWIFDWDKSPVGLPLDPYHAPQPCNGVWTFNFDGAAFIWDAYQVAKEDGMKDYLLFGQPSEMMLLRYLYKQEGWSPLEVRARKLLSYKVHWNNMRNPFLESPSVCYMHGRPKPHELTPHDPVRKLWEMP